MTTATHATRTTWVRGAIWSAAGVLVSGLALTLVGWFAAGRPGGVGAAVGTLVVAVVLLGGTAVVGVVSDLMPAASLLLALLTYTLQIVVLGVLLAGLRAWDGGAEHLAPTWFAGSVVAGALVWTVVQVVTAVRARIPTYEVEPGSALHRSPEGEEVRAR